MYQLRIEKLRGRSEVTAAFTSYWKAEGDKARIRIRKIAVLKVEVKS